MEIIFLFAFIGSIGVVGIYDKLSRMCDEKKKTATQTKKVVAAQEPKILKKSA